MKSKDQTDSPKVRETIARSVDFEVTIADLAKRSERRAWWVAASASFLCLLLASSYFLVLPLKEKVPYLVMADAFTGTSTVARLRDDFRNNDITTSEAIARSNVAHYIQARESYDYDIMRLRDWATVNTMSTADALASLNTLYVSEKSPYKIYGKSRAIRVKINSIIPIGGNGEPYSGATVNFQRSLFDKTTGTVAFLDNKVATLGFNYDPTLQMDDEARIANPLGFQVTTYRVDNDASSPPPPEIRTAATDAQGDILAPGGVVAPGQPASTGVPAVSPDAAAPASSTTPLQTSPQSQQQPATSKPNGVTP